MKGNCRYFKRAKEDLEAGYKIFEDALKNYLPDEEELFGKYKEAKTTAKDELAKIKGELDRWTRGFFADEE